jgi:hypothetical protein
VFLDFLAELFDGHQAEMAGAATALRDPALAPGGAH